MRAILILLAALAVACGSVHDRSECSASADCAAGSYCARTGDGSVCWPDAVAPAVSAVSVTCDRDPCLRSSVLHVEATVADDLELSGAEVTLDVGGPAIAMAPVGGGVWAADVPLARLPFEHFTHDVVATVTARDGARNEGSVASSPIAVTRLRFERVLESGISLTSPAVMDDGTVAAGGANHRLYLVAWDGDGVASVAVGTLQITAAPLALGGSVWVGSEDNKVYEVKKNGADTWDAFQRADTGGAVRSSLSLTSDARVIAASQSGFIFAVTSTGYMNSAPGYASSTGTVVDETGTIYLVASGAVRRFTIVSGSPTVDSGYSVTIGSSVGVPLALDSAVLVPSNNGAQGLLKRVLAAGGDPEHLATTGVPSAGIAVLDGGDILVPEETNKLTRWSSGGAPVATWTTPNLGTAPRTPIVLGNQTAPFVVSTAGGAVHALQPDGTIAWTAQFGTAALQPGNIYTPPGQPPDAVLSIAYFAGADGVLHAVIVDGKLDGSAPWPKAFHDPQNTNRAGAQP